MIKFFLTDIDAVNSKDSTLIRLFGRTSDRQGKSSRLCVIDNNFKPYFWAICKNKKSAEKFADYTSGIVVEDESEHKIISAEVKAKKFWGKKVHAVKITVPSQKAVSIFASVLRNHPEVLNLAETDINPVSRYLIDSGINTLCLCSVKAKESKKELIKPNKLQKEEGAEKCNFMQHSVHCAPGIKSIPDSKSEPVILAFDIETYNNGISYSNHDKDPIISIAFAGSNFQKVVTWKKFKTEDKNIVFVENEKQLIEEFIKTLRERTPDFLTGYFSDSFDLPYIIKRAKKYKINIDMEFGKAELKRRGAGSTARIPGVVHIDLLRFIRNIMGYALNTQNYDLDSVAKELIGYGKTDEFDIRNIGLAWDSGGKGVEQICSYNLNDAFITFRIGKKVLPSIIEISRIISQPAFNTARMTYGQMVEWFLVKRAPLYNELCPNRPSYERISSRLENTYQGAFVYSPSAGLYNNIAVLDFKSLYPTVIVAHNIGPTTLTSSRNGTSKSPPINYDGKVVHYYFKKEKALVPSSIKEIIIARNKLKKLYKKNRDPLLASRIYGLKTIANAAYGYLGFSGSRWYCMECAETITAFSREYIKDTIKKAKGRGFDVIYGDTDSIFIHLKKKSREDVISFLSEVNKSLPKIMELELEGFFKRGLFVSKRKESEGAKKKYALIDSQGNIKIVGFESIRGDWSLLAKKVQKKVIKIILEQNSPQKALEYVKKVIDKLKSGDISLEELVIKTQLKKKLSEYRQIGPHVAVARRMKQIGLPVGPGSTIRYIIERGKGNKKSDEKIRDRARIPEETREYDADYYINNQILPAVESIFEVLGFKRKDLLGYHEQLDLGGFMNK